MAPSRVKAERTQRERSEATTGELVEAARRLFAADGYQATSLDDVVRAAGVTKGALYHHFEGKPDLFRAVYELEQRRLAEAEMRAYAAESDHWEGLYAGCRAFFEGCLDPGVQRITLLDAPSVLGWEAMRELEAVYCLEQLREGLEIAIEEGKIEARPVRPLAHLLLGAMCEGAMMAARSEDPRAETEQMLSEVRQLLDGLAK